MKTQLDVNQLRTNLRKRATDTEVSKKIAIVRELMPDLAAWRRQGHSWSTIASWLRAEKIPVTGTYLSVTFKRESKREPPAAPPATTSPTVARLREREQKTFHHDASADLKKLI